MTVSDYNQAETKYELEKLFTHLGATLFRPDQQAFYDLWYRTELEVVHNNRLEVYWCKTQAHRSVLLRCKECHQQVVVEHGDWVRSERLAGLRRALVSFFVNPPLEVNQGETRV